jgi:hypothetical protein
MGAKVRSTTHDALFALVKAHNDTRRALVSTNPHASATGKVSGSFIDPTFAALAVSAANATNEATLVTLTVQLLAVYAEHIADDVGHKVQDTANVIAAAVPTNTATCVTALNELKADYNLHRASTTYHYNADATNAVASADANNEASAITLANEIKTDLNAHIIAALGGFGIDLVAP